MDTRVASRTGVRPDHVVLESGSVTTFSMEKNQGSTSLWLLPTERAAPRRLKACGEKDGQPA